MSFNTQLSFSMIYLSSVLIGELKGGVVGPPQPTCESSNSLMETLISTVLPGIQYCFDSLFSFAEAFFNGFNLAFPTIKSPHSTC